MRDTDVIDIAITIVLIVVALFIGNMMLKQQNWIGLTLLIIIACGLIAADLFTGNSDSKSRRARRFTRSRQRRRPLHTRQRSKFDYLPPPSAKDPLYPSIGNIKTPNKRTKKLAKKK